MSDTYINYEDYEKGPISIWVKEVKIENGCVNFLTTNNRIYIPIHRFHRIKEPIGDRL